MASASGVLSEEQYLCSICLHVFSQPVTIPCGHNFCKACITKYWDTDSNYCFHCPMCKKTFERRPDLFVNTLISAMATRFRIDSSHQQAAKPVEVPCDVCTGTKRKALKSCLVCLASYCETHLEPHRRVKAWKRHTLIDPVKNLEDRVCKKHGKLSELFCRSDHQAYVCVMCLNTSHKTHTVHLEEEQAQVEKIKTKVKHMIQEQEQKVQQIKCSIDLNDKDAEKERADVVEIFTALVATVEKNKAEFLKATEVKMGASKKRAEGLIEELEQEIAELQKRSAELDMLSQTEDHLCFLQSFPSLSTPPHATPAHAEDRSDISVRTDLTTETVRAVAQLEETLDKEMEKLAEVVMKKINLYAVDVILDPDTAHPKFVLSEDGKQVRLGDIRKALPDNPERFDTAHCVLGKEGFSSGRFCYEVQVKGVTVWSIGLARESLTRKDVNIENKLWLLRLRNGDEYSARHTSIIPLSLRVKPQKVGVFVDYEGGQISFYDPESRAFLYSFTGCNFTEKLFPLLCTGLYTDDAPLVITSVIKK